MKKQKPKLVIAPTSNIAEITRKDLEKVEGGGAKPHIPKIIEGQND